MTEGPIVKTITKLALPIMASSFLGTLYNICDMAWVGTLGAKVVAGVGVGGMYMWFLSGFAMLPRMGGQVLTAQSIGAGNSCAAKQYTRAAIQLVILFGFVFGVLCALIPKQLVGFFQLTDEASVSSGTNYLRIACGFSIFTFLNVTLTGLYTADGDSKTPMFANLAGLALNMILDPVLIMGIWIFPEMKEYGAAAATVIAQLIVSVILLWKMRAGHTRTEIFHDLDLFALCPKNIYLKIAVIGAPASLQELFYCFVSMMLTRFTASFGSEAVAVSRVGGQIESVSWNTADGFASALNAFCGQNYGAKKYDRVRKGYLFSNGTAFAWGILVLACFVLFPKQISGLFFHEPEAIAVSVSYLVIVGLSEPFLMAEIVTQGALCGLGRTKLSSVISMAFTGLRIPLAIAALHFALGINGMWWVYTVTSMLKGIIFTAVFLNVKPESRQPGKIA